MPHLHMKKYVSVAAIGLRIVESSGGSDAEKPACEFWSREQLNKFGMKEGIGNMRYWLMWNE